MTNRIQPCSNAVLFAGFAIFSGCAVGPSTRVPSAPIPTIAQTEGATPLRARAILDSLDIARSTERAGSMAPISVTAPLAVDPARDLAWLEVLRDPQLVSLVNAAVANNRELRIAEARVREYRARLGSARSDLFPEIIVSGNSSRNRSAFGPAGQFDDVQVIGDLSWELDFWGRVRRQSQAARFDLGAGQEDMRALTLLLVSDVAAAYLRLRELDGSLRIADQTLASRRATLELARRRFQQGMTSELDVRLFEAELADPAARVAEFARQRTQVENQLAQLIGTGPTAIPPCEPIEDVVLAVSVPDSIPGELIARRPDVLAAEHFARASVARIGVANANRLPTTSIGGRYGAQGPALGGLPDRLGEVYTLQIGVSVPVFTGGRLRAEEHAARARADQAKAQYEEIVLIALRESSDALAGVRFGRDQMVARATQTQALQRAFTIAETRYRSGVSSYLEVLDAQRQLFSAQLALLQAERQYLVSTVDLFRALGGGWDIKP